MSVVLDIPILNKKFCVFRKLSESFLLEGRLKGLFLIKKKGNLLFV